MSETWPLPARPAGRAALFVGAACLAAAALAVVLAPAVLLRPWYFAWLACLNLALGALALLLIHRLTGGAWGERLGVPLRAAAATLPALALLMLPLWFAQESIFPWAGEAGTTQGFAGHQAQWLRPGLLRIRALSYFAVWLLVAGGLGLWPLRRPLRQGAGRAAAGAIGFALATSLFAVDWIMALIPVNSTTMIGFLLIGAQLGAALALAALWRGLRGRVDGDSGNLLLAALMFHGYCLYMDYLIVWEANAPGEIAWYLERTRVFGGVLVWLMVLLFIALPIFGLLFRRLKRSPAGLAAIAATALLGHLLLVYWYLAPLAAAAPGWPAVARDWALGLLFMALWGGAFHALALHQRETPTREEETHD